MSSRNLSPAVGVNLSVSRTLANKQQTTCSDAPAAESMTKPVTLMLSNKLRWMNIHDRYPTDVLSLVHQS